MPDVTSRFIMKRAGGLLTELSTRACFHVCKVPDLSLNTSRYSYSIYLCTQASSSVAPDSHLPRARRSRVQGGTLQRCVSPRERQPKRKETHDIQKQLFASIVGSYSLRRIDPCSQRTQLPYKLTHSVSVYSTVPYRRYRTVPYRRNRTSTYKD